MEPRELSISRRIRAAIDQQRRTASDLNKVEQQHLQSVEQQIDAIARGDLDAAIVNASADVQLDTFAPPEFKWISRARGIAELRNALAHNYSTLQDQSPEILNVVAQGDTVVLMGRETGRIRATGEPYDVEFVEKFTFDDGRLVAVRIIAARRTG